MRELASLGDTLSSGEVTLTEIAFTYTTISGRANRQIDVALQSLSEEGQMTAAEVRLLPYLGLALLVGGGVVSATGYGWTGRRTRVLTRDIEETRELDALKSEFVALASHELRTPLTGIYGFSRLLMDDDEVSIEERREWAGYIHSEATRLTTIVENLLNVSRIESGTLDLRTEPVHVNEVIDTVLRSFDGGSELHSFEIAGDLERVVLGDRNKLVEVLGNLVDNAVKYSPRGGVVRIEGAGRAGAALGQRHRRARRDPAGRAADRIRALQACLEPGDGARAQHGPRALPRPRAGASDGRGRFTSGASAARAARSPSRSRSNGRARRPSIRRPNERQPHERRRQEPRRNCRGLRDALRAGGGRRARDPRAGPQRAEPRRALPGC